MIKKRFFCTHMKNGAEGINFFFKITDLKGNVDSAITTKPKKMRLYLA